MRFLVAETYFLLELVNVVVTQVCLAFFETVPGADSKKCYHFYRKEGLANFKDTVAYCHSKG